jgi:hypothetical protein
VSDRFLVQADRQAVGVAIRVPGGFRFFSSAPQYFELEGRTYPKVRLLDREVAAIASRRKRANDNQEPDEPPPSAA